MFMKIISVMTFVVVLIKGEPPLQQRPLDGYPESRSSATNYISKYYAPPAARVSFNLFRSSNLKNFKSYGKNDISSNEKHFENSQKSLSDYSNINKQDSFSSRSNNIDSTYGQPMNYIQKNDVQKTYTSPNTYQPISPDVPFRSFMSTSASNPSANYGGPSTTYEPSNLNSNYGTPNLNAKYNLLHQHSEYNAPNLNSNYGVPNLNTKYNTPNLNSKLNTKYNAPTTNVNYDVSNLNSNFATPNLNSKYGAPTSNSKYSQTSMSSIHGKSEGYYNNQRFSTYGPPQHQRDPSQSSEYMNEPANYEYSYDVKVGDHGTEFGHEESRDDDSAWGSYKVLLPDGRTQIVEYTADNGGFRPKITYQESQNQHGGY